MLDFMDFLLPILIFLLMGVVAITFGIAWMIAKAHYQKEPRADKTATANAQPSGAVPRVPHLLTFDRGPDGAWEIAINGKPYPSLEAVPDDAVRRDVVAGLKEAALFARSYIQKDQAETRPPAPPQAAAPTERVPLAEKQAERPAEGPADVPPTTPSAMDKLRGLFKSEAALKRSGAAPTLMPAIDLAHEIGEIVAEMQARNPSLAQRSIKLQNIATGGVQFTVDDMIYFDINEIPDADIQALIRAATKEWERR